MKNPKGISPENRDKYGFRNWELTQIDGSDEMRTTSTSFTRPNQTRQVQTRGFSRSKRLDLARPENFNPGPGAYRITRYLENVRRRRSGHCEKHNE